MTPGTATARDSVEISWTLMKFPTVVEPITPAIEQQECAGPGDSPGVDLHPVTTRGIDYEYSRAAVFPGAVVDVTAVPREGFELAPAPGWEIRADGTAVTEIRLPEPECPAEELRARPRPRQPRLLPNRRPLRTPPITRTNCPIPAHPPSGWSRFQQR